MNVRVEDREYDGPAVDLTTESVTAAEVLAGVRGADGPVTVSCSKPGRVHDYVGVVREDSTLPTRAALAAAARSRGLSAPQDRQLTEAEERLAALDPPTVDLAERRTRVAATTGAETELRERVATLQGRVQARRETGAKSAEVEAELAEATRELSEAETERIAAEQSLARARARVRSARNVRRERLRLQDRVGNLRRAARRHLAERLHDAFADALAAMPGRATAGSTPGTVEGDETTAALAVARVATLEAPVVLDCRRFDDADEAATRLDAPVVRL